MSQPINYSNLFKSISSFIIFLCYLNPLFLFSANYYWIGSSSGNWNSTTNWSLSPGGSSVGVLPGNSDIVIFDGSRNTNCTINLNVNVSGFIINSTYTSTVNINDGRTVTVMGYGFSQSSGIFTGNSGIVSIYGVFDLVGGTFSYTGLLEVATDGSNQVTANIDMDFESSSEPNEVEPYRAPDPNDNGNGCMDGASWNEYYKFNVCIAPASEFSDFAIERSNTYSRTGNYSTRFYLKPSNPNVWPIGEPNHRAELAPHHNSPIDRYPVEGEEMWYGISYFFPTNFVFAPESIMNDVRFIIAQWQHGSPGSPLIALEVMGDEIVLQRQGGNSTSPTWYDPVSVGTIQRGQWMDMTVQVKWSKTGGLVNIWLGGQLVYTMNNIQTIYNNINNGGGYKIGLYYWRWKEKQSVQNSLNAGINYREIFVDEVKEYHGTNGYSVVAPGGQN